MQIITNPDPRLRRRAKRVEPRKIASQEIQRFISALGETMKEDNGIGIAAPQVAENSRIIIVETGDGPTVFINPWFIWKSFGQEIGEEGCLSVPGIWGLVKRSKSVFISYYDRAGNFKLLWARGLLARILQHEVDHLNGILFIDRMIGSEK
jgi:peptide deformylase